MKKKDEGPEGLLRCQPARKFFSDLHASHTQLELNEFLSTALELPDFGLIKLGPEL